MNTKTSNKRIDWIYIVLFVLALVLSFFITNKKAFASDVLPSDVIKKFGFTDNNMHNVDEYEYHFICDSSVSGVDVLHFYSNTPLKLKHVSSSGYHGLIMAQGYDGLVFYNKNLKTYYDVTPSSYASYTFFRFLNIEKSDILYQNFIPVNYTSEAPYKTGIYLVKGPLGIQVADNSLEDLGYPKGSVFFFQGHYTPESDVSPLVPGESTPIDDGGLSDDDKSWFSGLFGGITQSLENAKNAILSGVASAFEAVGQTIVNGIKAIFIPDSEFLTEKIESVKEKFAFIDNIKDAFDNVSSLVTDGNETVPVMTVDLSKSEGNFNYGTSAVALDMNWYSRYKPYADGIIIAFAYISFIFLVFKRAPEIIKGSGAITKGID